VNPPTMSAPISVRTARRTTRSRRPSRSPRGRSWMSTAVASARLGRPCRSARGPRYAAGFASYGGGSVKGAWVVAVAGRPWREACGSGVSGRRGVRGSATLGQPHIRAPARGRQDPGSSQRPLSGIERRRRPGRAGGSQAKARTFVCARCPDRRAASTRQRVMSLQGQGAVAISQQAPISSRAIAIVTTPAGLPRPSRSSFQRACRRRWTRHA
jgi:hypothetical protein